MFFFFFLQYIPFLILSWQPLRLAISNTQLISACSICEFASKDAKNNESPSSGAVLIQSFSSSGQTEVPECYIRNKRDFSVRREEHWNLFLPQNKNLRAHLGLALQGWAPSHLPTLTSARCRWDGSRGRGGCEGSGSCARCRNEQIFLTAE